MQAVDLPGLWFSLSLVEGLRSVSALHPVRKAGTLRRTTTEKRSKLAAADRPKGLGAFPGVAINIGVPQNPRDQANPNVALVRIRNSNHRPAGAGMNFPSVAHFLGSLGGCARVAGDSLLKDRTTCGWKAVQQGP